MLSEIPDVLTKEIVHKNLGEFSDKAIMKKNARIGQSFSSTNWITTLEKEQVEDLDDLESGILDVPYTDGAGFISSKLSFVINEIFEL